MGVWHFPIINPSIKVVLKTLEKTKANPTSKTDMSAPIVIILVIMLVNATRSAHAVFHLAAKYPASVLYS
jgi:hypothetical protein